MNTSPLDLSIYIILFFPNVPFVGLDGGYAHEVFINVLYIFAMSVIMVRIITYFTCAHLHTRTVMTYPIIDNLLLLFTVSFLTSMKRRCTYTTGVDMAKFNDISFPRTCPGADYDTCWNDCFHDRNIFAITSCYESAVMFAAREG